MSEIRFDEEVSGQGYTSRKILGERVQPKMVTFLTKMGINPQTAGYILLSIAVLAFVISAYLLFSFGFLGSRRDFHETSLGSPINTN